MDDIQLVEADQCLLCRSHALAWEGENGTCEACGAVFVFDPPSATLYYLHVPDAYAAFSPELTAGWLTREEALAIASGSAEGAPADAGAIARNMHIDPPRAIMLLVAGLVTLLVVLGIAAFTLSKLREPQAPGAPSATSIAPTSGLPTAAAKAATPLISPLPTPVAVQPTATRGAPSVALPLTNAGGQPTSAAPPLVQTANAAASSTAAAGGSAPPTARLPAPSTLAPSLINSPVPVTLPPTFTPVPNTATATVGESATSAATESATPSSTPVPSQTPSASSAPSATPTRSPSPTPVRTLVITRIKFMGDDGKDETAEFIELRNFGSQPAQLGGWRVFSRSRDRAYFFPAQMTMFGGDVCRFYSGGSVGGSDAPGSTCPRQDLVDVPDGGDLWQSADSADVLDTAGNTVAHCAYGPITGLNVTDVTCQ